MATMNRVFLLGNLTRDPEVRYLPSGKGVAELRLAISHKYKLTTGEEREETCFIDVVVWGKQGEACGQYLSKGSPLLVEGRLQYEEWEKDGQKRSRLRVVADRTQFIGAPRRAEYTDAAPDSAASAPAPKRTGAQAPVAAMEPGAPAGDDEDLPF